MDQFKDLTFLDLGKTLHREQHQRTTLLDSRETNNGQLREGLSLI